MNHMLDPRLALVIGLVAGIFLGAGGLVGLMAGNEPPAPPRIAQAKSKTLAAICEPIWGAMDKRLLARVEAAEALLGKIAP